MILKNARKTVLNPPSIQPGDLRVEAGKIVESSASLVPGPGEEVKDLGGKLLMPGFVCAHTHLYSSLARGMPGPKTPPRNFLEILKKVWWKLDRALDEESIYASALVGAIEAVQSGTTMLIDHHASPRCIPGSLDIIREAVERVGLRSVLCYEVTDRGGVRERDQGLEENERFLRSTSPDSLSRGLVGAHASFTLSDDSLRLCGQMAERNRTGVHIHVAEDLCDVKDARKRGAKGVVARLRTHGIMTDRSILAHCVHLVPQEFRAVGKAECWQVHNPRSNMNNNVGHAPLHLFNERAALGTDGFPADMLEEARAGFLRNQELEGLKKAKVSFDGLLSGGLRLASEIFGQKFGAFEKGAAADFAVLDYVPPTPMTKDNLPWHLLFGMRSSMVESVMVNGAWVMEDGRVTGVSVEAELTRSSAIAAKLWARMNG